MNIKDNTRKIADTPKIKICHHPEHNPPIMRHFPAGSYEHKCPQCGKITFFTVPEITM